MMQLSATVNRTNLLQALINAEGTHLMTGVVVIIVASLRERAVTVFGQAMISLFCLRRCPRAAHLRAQQLLPLLAPSLAALATPFFYSTAPTSC